ncbi:M15 family metallopeptidase [Solitalea koreensis]|uniref:D-alanyl-D-alanine dipeptidase n=1 Tax=Solitalea koreensis TaxID=543615 RepID=A0A521B1D0_9SPHI|nr:M15 family metallopeptidase [Solitalea koreensis]SMO40580.1 D-alanyl-D-alanine dipeptidase [Solitalea koreensis]
MKILLTTCFGLFVATAFAQEIKPNKYGLKVVSDVEVYKQQVAKDSSNELVEIKKCIPNIVLDIRYATSNNFMEEPVYTTVAAFTRLPVVRALQKIQHELNKQGLGLKIFDAYRPYSVTVAFFEKKKDSVFLALPSKGSRHNRGCAIDLTIVKLKNGKELKMPTPYDSFSTKAYADCADLPKNVIKNRELLKSIMSKYGFTVYKEEWWHYDYNGWKAFDHTDLTFEQLLSLKH